MCNSTALIRRMFILTLLLVVTTAFAMAQRCQATTKKGAQCKRNAQSGSVYCWQHRGMYEEPKSQPAPAATEDKGQKEIKETVAPQRNESKQCQATTKKGKQCSRRAKPGSNYCWQHGG